MDVHSTMLKASQNKNVLSMVNVRSYRQVVPDIS